MKTAIALMSFLVLTNSYAYTPAVSGGNLGVCDSEKEILFAKFLETNLNLRKFVYKLLSKKYSQSCAVGSSNLVQPNLSGAESNQFSVTFMNDSFIYNVIISYKAQRFGMKPGYKGHISGMEDGTVLRFARMIDFQVEEKANDFMGIGF